MSKYGNIFNFVTWLARSRNASGSMANFCQKHVLPSPVIDLIIYPYSLHKQLGPTPVPSRHHTTSREKDQIIVSCIAANVTKWITLKISKYRVYELAIYLLVRTIRNNCTHCKWIKRLIVHITIPVNIKMLLRSLR